VDTSPAVHADLGWTLGAVFRAYRLAAERVLQDMPGGPRGYQVLSAASDATAGSQFALAQRLGIDRTVMTYLIDDLEQAGLAERRADPCDRRARRLALTDAGRERLHAVERGLQEAEEGLLAPLAPDERATLRRLLRQVAVGADDAVGPEGPQTPGGAVAVACRAAEEPTGC
jgi:DNA-binding MarR family transcriptional regulator